MSEEITRDSLFPNGTPGTREWNAHVKEQRAHGRDRDEPEQEEEQAAEGAQEQAAEQAAEQGAEQAQASDAAAEPNQPAFDVDPNSLDYQSSVIRHHETTLNAQKQELAGFAQMVEQQVRAGMDPRMALSAKMQIEQHANRIAQEEQALGALKRQHDMNAARDVETAVMKRHPEFTTAESAKVEMDALTDWLHAKGRKLTLSGLTSDRAVNLFSETYREFKAARRAAMSDSERQLDDLDQRLRKSETPGLMAEIAKAHGVKIKSKVKPVNMKNEAQAQDHVDGGYREPNISSRRGAPKPALDRAEVTRSVDSAQKAADRAKDQGLSRHEQRKAARQALGLPY